MTNKNTPATADLIFATELSNFSDTDKHLNSLFKAKTGRPAKLDFNQLTKCLELKRKYTCDTWLGLYRCLLDKTKNGEVSLNLPTYANFLKSIKRLILYLFHLTHYQTEINKQIFFKQQIKIAFVDSTPLSVCKVIRSSRHKTMEEYAQYSKSTTGWYYGFKLHLTCNFETKEVIDFNFSNAKLDDRKYLEKIMKESFLNTETMFVVDKGYQAKWLEELAKDTGNYLLTGKKKSKNMRILASQFDIYLLHIRARIESIFSDLKVNCFLTNTRSRSVLGYLFNYVLAIYYLVFKKKMSFDI
jgi:penicillin-binding protein-related factor A (putative recombinase)